jgi:hypothetical protein
MELLEDGFSLARTVVLNIAAGVARLYERLPPSGGFPEPPAPAAPECSPGPLDLVERSLVLMRVPLLRGAGVQALTDIAASAEEIELAPGEPLTERAGVTRFCVVADGMLSARFGPASLLFGAAAFTPGSGGWRAQAVTRARLLVLPLEDWIDQMEEHFEAVRATLRLLALEREGLVDELARRAGELVLT